MNIQVNINTLITLRAGSIAEAIEKLVSVLDTIASGPVGPDYSTSGPGVGWVVRHSVSDSARRALEGEDGMVSYIDSSDGREATMNEDGDIEWSAESVVEVRLPTAEEALAHPDEWKLIEAEAADYGVDQERIDALAVEIEQERAAEVAA